MCMYAHTHRAGYLFLCAQIGMSYPHQAAELVEKWGQLVSWMRIKPGHDTRRSGNLVMGHIGPYWAMIATENGPFVDRLPESLRRTHMIFHSKLLKYQRVCWTLAQSNHYMILIHVKCGIIKMHPNSPSCSGCYQDGPP